VDRFDPELAVAVATVQAFLDRAEALRAVLLLDRGEGEEPVVIDLDAAGELEIARGEEVRAVDPRDFSGAVPLGLGDVHPLAGIEVDPAEGLLTAPIGAIERAAGALRATARLFGERSVFSAAFTTSDPEEPLFLAARGEEPLVLSLGGREWELPG
jgi:hypothetical protein